MKIIAYSDKAHASLQKVIGEIRRCPVFDNEFVVKTAVEMGFSVSITNGVYEVVNPEDSCIWQFELQPGLWGIPGSFTVSADWRHLEVEFLSPACEPGGRRVTDDAIGQRIVQSIFDYYDLPREQKIPLEKPLKLVRILDSEGCPGAMLVLREENYPGGVFARRSFALDVSKIIDLRSIL